MKGDRMKAVHAATLAVAIGGGCAPVARHAADPALESQFKQLLQHDFHARGSAGMDRLEQDPVQRTCTETRDRPQGAQQETLLKEQFGLRMQAATQQLQNSSKLKDVRRGIARVRTLMHQKAAGATQ